MAPRAAASRDVPGAALPPSACSAARRFARWVPLASSTTWANYKSCCRIAAISAAWVLPPEMIRAS